MVFPKKGQPRTYKDRAKAYSLAGALVMFILLVVAIVLGIWPGMIIAIIGLVGAALTWFDAERKTKDSEEKLQDFGQRKGDDL